jgi:hypothetical protein
MKATITQFLWSALIAAIVLFLWSGLAQAVLPWGVPSAKVFLSQSNSKTTAFKTHPGQVTQFKNNELTTPLFDKKMVNEVNTLMTDETFSWIITKPLAYYDPSAYLVREALTQSAIALGLALLLVLTRGLSLKNRILLVAVAALCGGLAGFGQMYNWWGLTAAYAFGMVINIVLGWTLASFVIARFIAKSTTTEKE